MLQYTTSIWHHYMYLVERTLRRSVSGVSCLTCNLCPRILFSNSWVPVQRKEMHYSYVILKRKQYFQFFRISSLSLGSKFNTEKCRPSILSHNTDKCDRVFSLTAGDDKIVFSLLTYVKLIWKLLLGFCFMQVRKLRQKIILSDELSRSSKEFVQGMVQENVLVLYRKLHTHIHKYPIV